MTSLTTNQTGGIHSQQRYYPYGEVRWSSGTLPTDLQYTGQRNETTLGIYDYKARFYSPRLGRFLSADTLVPGVGSQHLSRYMYVTGNVVRYNDPTGHVFDDGSDDRLLSRGHVPRPNTRPRRDNSSRYADSTEGILSGPARGFGLPFPQDKVTWYHGFGNTQFADEHQHTWYRNTCGKHCGIDFVVPYNTPLYWMGTGPAKIYAIDALNTTGNLRGFRAGPHNIVLEYGGYYIIFGHTSWDTDRQIVKQGDVIYPGQLFGWTGDTDGDFDGKPDNNSHLHLEIRPIREPDKSIIINPAFFFRKDLYQLFRNSTYLYPSDQGPYSIYLYSMITCKITLFYGEAE